MEPGGACIRAVPGALTRRYLWSRQSSFCYLPHAFQIGSVFERRPSLARASDPRARSETHSHTDAQTSATMTTAAEGPRSNSWMDEQAAEYADLVGSFVESVIDSDTEEMIEYQLIWEGGDLGVALTPLDSKAAVGVQVSRVTGKGFPFGIKNVGPGDILLSINLRDTTKLTLDQVVGYLQECDLPATLRFKKMSPDTDKAPPAVPRRSTYTITSNGPTSPQGSAPGPGRVSVASAGRFSAASSNRGSQKNIGGRPSSYGRIFEDDYEEDEDEGLDIVANLGKDEEDDELVEDSHDDDPRLLRKQSSSMPLLGDFSTATSTIPIMPEASMASNIGVIDDVAQPQMPVYSGEEEVSPVGQAVQPVMLRSTTDSLDSLGDDLVKPETAARGSVRVMTDSGRGMESMMKSQPIGSLHEMCAKGNVRGVVQHLRVEGPEGLITREPNHGQTCLHLAVKSGNVQLAKLILEQYKPLEELINLEDDKGNAALHFAATKTPGMVHLLLENGASSNVKNSRKLTPLIISVITSKDDNVIIPRMLLKFGANPNDMHDGQTVIHTAIGTGRLQIAGALVKAGAKMDVEDSEGKNVFEKLDRRSTRFLISHIYFPPTYITEKERQECMLCHKKIKFGHRKCNCTHCGRFCCSECCSLSVEMHKFPMGFPGRVRRGAAVRDQKRVCKTCYNVFKERTEEPQKQENRFLNRIIGVEWDEINPNKLQTSRAAAIAFRMAPHNSLSAGDVCVEDSRANLAAPMDAYDARATSSMAYDNATTSTPSSDTVTSTSASREHAIIFFDWDDTLLASSAVAKLGLCPKYVNEKPTIPEDVQEELKELEDVVVQVLNKALTYGRVVIVTAAEAGWVELSASLFLPRVVPLLNTQIKVISARSTYEYLYPDCARRWKIEAFIHEVFPVWETYDSDDDYSCLPQHIISLGDGPTEREALINIKMQAMDACFGKSMKFITYPKISELRMELELILSNMDHLCTHEGDLDLQITWEMLNSAS
ncbi:TPA: hypothetical protein N0F65_002134 [Lagenidium giganteum]|uniref:Uncharacterized protein n=1 Tax=Lagenidium giganteum TaxID=4803 RepID=A0AAV2ZC95_9STRA|nr:TPA: hypothetical protein N0F65_002134 [Lagenidium giganteum]